MLTFKQFLEEQDLTEATSGKNKWIKYFAGKGDVATTIFHTTKYYDEKGKLLGNLEKGTPVTYTDKRKSWADPKAVFKTQHEVQLEDGKKVYVSFADIGKPGSKSAAKEQSGLKPSDFLKDFSDLTPQGIVTQTEQAFGKDSPLVKAVKETIKSGYPTTPISLSTTGLNDKAVTNYFAEVLQPIAIINGNFHGNAVDGMKAIAGIESPKGYTINFSTSTTTGLYDSFLKKGDSQINISSKFGSASTGAAASVTNLYAIYDGYKDKKIFTQFENEVEIIKIIADQTKHMAPLSLAEKFRLINSTEKATVLKLKDNPEAKITQNLAKLRDTITPGKDNTPIPYYHVIAGIAKSISAHINANTQFSRFASLLLNGTVIQVYTKATVRGDLLGFSKFDTKWPDDSVSQVLIESRTRYKTDRIDGKMGFIIKSKG